MEAECWGDWLESPADGCIGHQERLPIQLLNNFG
jgi:hypothetical protein